MSEKCLIIGLGQIGMGYDLELDPTKAVYSHARAFSLHPAFELLGAVDPSASQRALFEGHYSRPTYPDTESALKAEMPTVVVIASPTVKHSEVLSTVLSHSKPKVVLCEKPLTYDLAEARKMVEACENAGVKLFVNYMRRADPGAIEIKKRIESMAIAAPIKGVAWYSKGFLHNGSHFFNLLEFWLGAFVKATVLNPGRFWDNQDPEPDVHVDFERGKVVFQAAWEEAFSHYTLELLSPSGRLRYDQGGEYIAWQSTHSDPNFSGYKILQAVPEIIANGMNQYQWHVADQLAAALAVKPNSLCTGRQALATLYAMHQIINQR
ncbi:MAG: Gfo/Idh/MocA family oxidoreductase [Anaerolineaceae bacterium]|nr:Gfo/Idh/MocA family oxidoreductase [Betaproteobacteria bacterium]